MLSFWQKIITLRHQKAPANLYRKVSHIDSQGRPRVRTSAKLKGAICPLFHAQEIFQVRHSQVYPRGQPVLQGTWENATVMEPYLGENTSGYCKNTARRWLKDWHRVRFLKSSPVPQRKRWSLLERKIKDDRSAIRSEDSHQFSTTRSHGHQSSTRSVRQESGCIDAFSQKDWEKIRIAAVSCWILKTRGFNKIWRTWARRIWNEQRLKNWVLFHSSRHWIRKRRKKEE